MPMVHELNQPEMSTQLHSMDMFPAVERVFSGLSYGPSSSLMTAQASEADTMRTLSNTVSALDMTHSVSAIDLPQAADLNGTDEVVCPLAEQEEEDRPRWCNFLYTTKCPFCVNHACGMMEPCKFIHLDSYVRMDDDARQALAMPDLMTRHMKGLGKEMSKIVDAQAQRALTSWFVVKAWGGAEEELLEDVSPYCEVVTALRELGWHIADSDKRCTSTRLEDAPYYDDVQAIIGLVASCLHYNFARSDDVLFETIRYVFTLDKPAMKCPEPELEDGDIMGAFETEEVCNRRADCASEAGSSDADTPTSPTSPTKNKRRRRSNRSSQARKQRAAKAAAAAAALETTATTHQQVHNVANSLLAQAHLQPAALPHLPMAMPFIQQGFQRTPVMGTPMFC